MKTLEELVAFVDLVLGPKLDIDAALAQLGSVRHWAGSLAYLDSSDPRLTGVVLETARDELHGVQAELVTPLEVSWNEIEQAFGSRAEAPRVVDAWSGPVPYRFVREQANGSGRIYLDVTETDDAVRIERMVVRRGLVALPATG